MSDPVAQPSPDSGKRVGYERTDASAWYIGLFALALALTIILAMWLLHQMFWRFEASVEREDPLLSPVVASQVPPEPRLETLPGADLQKMRAAENEILTTYRWIDQTHGIVQIPIDRAIQLLSEQGFAPAEGSDPAATAAGAEDAEGAAP